MVKNEEKYLLLTLKEDWIFERGQLILNIFKIFLLQQEKLFLMIKLFSCQMCWYLISVAGVKAEKQEIMKLKKIKNKKNNK